MKDTIREDTLCLYCLTHSCYNCEYQTACVNFCEHYVFYPAVLTDGKLKDRMYYDGEHPSRIWDN